MVVAHSISQVKTQALIGLDEVACPRAGSAVVGSASGCPLVYAWSATSQGRVIVQGVEFDEIQEKVGRSGGV